MSQRGNLETRRAADLRPWKENPRVMDAEGEARLRHQLLTLKQYKPLIITPEGEVLAGNQRLRLLTDLGVVKIWCLVVEPESEAEKLEIAFGDNENDGFYIPERLAYLLKDVSLPAEDLQNFGIDTGFYVPVDAAAAREGLGKDEDGSKDALDTYEKNPVKQIVFFFEKADMPAVEARMAAAREQYDVSSNEEAVEKLLDAYEGAL